jgi:hypothetical protein
MNTIKYTSIEAARLLRDDLPPGYGFVLLVFPAMPPVRTEEPNACFVCSHDEDVATRAMAFFLMTKSPFEVVTIPPDES